MPSVSKSVRELDDLEAQAYVEPVLDVPFYYGDFELVGNGKVTNEDCGTFSAYWGCLRTELHDFVTLEGVNYKGKVFYRKTFHSCDKPTCPRCFRRGWAVREAHNIERRLAEAVKRFGKGNKRIGKVEHIVCSPNPKDYGLPFEVLRGKVIEMLKARGVVGGVLIFHGFRCRNKTFWYWSPHWHVLGFIVGGYGCRGCKLLCSAHNCNGFEGRERKENLKDGCIVKVLEERKDVYAKYLERGEKRKSNVMGTAVYQLGHASVKKGSVRFHVATWFGCCSYHKLKVVPEFKKRLCPLCLHELVELLHKGDGFPKGDKGFDDRFDASGRANWVERESCARGYS